MKGKEKKCFSRSSSTINKIRAEIEIHKEARRWDQVCELQEFLGSLEEIESALEGFVAAMRKEESEGINIWAGAGENAHLSNMTERPFVAKVRGKSYRFRSVEHYYQSLKAYCAGDIETARSICLAKNGFEAKKLSRQVSMSQSSLEKWDRIKLRVMSHGIRESFFQNPNAAEALLSTGNAIITHIDPRRPMADDYWRAYFPFILTLVRSRLREKI